MLMDERSLMMSREKTWGAFVESVRNFDDMRLVQEIDILERMIDSDCVHESILYDCVLDLYEVLRDECVLRLAKKSGYLESSSLSGEKTVIVSE